MVDGIRFRRRTQTEAGRKSVLKVRTVMMSLAWYIYVLCNAVQDLNMTFWRTGRIEFLALQASKQESKQAR